METGPEIRRVLVKATQQQFAVRQPCGTWLIVIRFANRDPLAGQRVELDYARITDAGLEHMKGLNKLQILKLDNSQVTDAGLVHLKGLTKLKWLELSNTKVTDAGVMYLKGLTNLEVLVLYSTQVTDAGVKKLQQALPNCTIYH